MRLLLLTVALVVSVAAVAAPVEKSLFGTLPDGRAIEAYTLNNGQGATAIVITYGAILADLRMPDAEGKTVSVVHVTTFSPEKLQHNFPEAGPVIGRVANRIAYGRFTLDGHDYHLATNTPPHHLHGGRIGFDHVLWTPLASRGDHVAAVSLRYRSKDGEEGYPGNLTVTVTYTLTKNNTLRIDYTGTTDQPTVLNLTNHSYFNLAGEGDVTQHVLDIAADQFTPTDATLIPTGELRSVAGTPYDFRAPTPLGAHAADLKFAHYDINFVLRHGDDKKLSFAARLRDPTSGRRMEVWTTEPGLQLYTTKLNGPLPPDQIGRVCLETQHFPDAIHHANFPSIVLRPGVDFRSTTEYRFSNQ